MTSDDKLMKWLVELEADERFKTNIHEAEVVKKAVARIRELEAENHHLKNSAELMRKELIGVYAETHVIVPVEPSMDVLNIGALAFEDAQDRGYTRQVCMMWAHTAMIRAAQPGASD